MQRLLGDTMSELTPQLRERIENTIRFLSVDAVARANSGHVGAPMGLARAAFELWDAHLRFDPQDVRWPLRDRFVLSNGHASMLQYSLLRLYGVLSQTDIELFRNLGSRTPGHPEYGETPGIEVTTGPLGQGFAHAVGMALAGRLARSRFGKLDSDGDELLGPGEHFVYGIVGDGDLMEGVSSEAGSLAGHLGLGNLIFLYDDNLVTIDGPTSLSFSEDVPARFEAYGWHVETVDGEDHERLASALARSRSETERPSLIVTKTLVGRGSDAIAGQAKAHGWSMKPEDIRAAKEAVGWPVEEELYIPDDVAAYFMARLSQIAQTRGDADARHGAWRRAHPERAQAWDAARERKLPANLGALLSEGMEGVDNPTRAHSATVIARLAEHVPYMVGGSADLAGSGAPPIVKGAGIVGPGAGEGVDPFAGKNIHFGVREHAMAAVTNGIGLDGTFIPYSGTFLIFSDYMRPAIRLSALMKVRSIFVFTHDSIFVGEDGPTHQPVEQVDGLRSVPGLTVFRPADGVETAMAYAWILEKAEGPCALSLTRHKVPAVERDSGFEPYDVWRGGYTVRECDGAPRVVLLASGSEVSLACQAASALNGDGVPARVVSVPCQELFAQQPEEYQLALVPDDDTLVVAVEAAYAQSFRRWVGRRGIIHGMESFGASGPYAELGVHFGFTAEALILRIRSAL
jgi:transketolase